MNIDKGPKTKIGPGGEALYRHTAASGAVSYLASAAHVAAVEAAEGPEPTDETIEQDLRDEAARGLADRSAI